MTKSAARLAAAIWLAAMAPAASAGAVPGGHSAAAADASGKGGKGGKGGKSSKKGKKGKKGKRGKKGRKGTKGDVVRITALGGVGGGMLELYDGEDLEESKQYADDAAQRAVGIGPAARLSFAVPVSVRAKGSGGRLCVALDLRYSRLRYAQAPTLAGLEGANAGSDSSFAEAGSTVAPTYRIATHGRGGGFAFQLNHFEALFTGGLLRGAVQTTIDGEHRDSELRGFYLAPTFGYRFDLSKDVHILTMVETLVQPLGIVADDPGAVFPLSNQLAIPSYRVTGLLGLRVDL